MVQSRIELWHNSDIRQEESFTDEDVVDFIAVPSTGDGSAHPMPHWMQAVFIETLPKYIGIKRAEVLDDISDRGSSVSGEAGQLLDSRRPSPFFLAVPTSGYEDEKKKTRGEHNKMRLSQLAHLRGLHPDLIRRMTDNVSFIADHFRAIKEEDKRLITLGMHSSAPIVANVKTYNASTPRLASAVKHHVSFISRRQLCHNRRRQVADDIPEKPQ
ncbi:hypothetical protein RB195_023801 [Necator americanus]|uniref:Uncharacterized protein n=1 Tax=Necator americanus TaxID=51031 RepID=A0ABR1EMV7_NECAM